MICPTPTLIDYFESQYVLYRSIQPGSAAAIRTTLRQFAAWLGHMPLLSEMCDELVCRWVMHLEAVYAPKTAHNKRGDVLGVWTDAYGWDKSGAVQQPRRVRRIHVPDPEPQSWSALEVASLVAAARTMPGRFAFGVPRAAYLEALLRTAWESGLRRGDLLALKLEHIGADGTIQKVQRKTGSSHCGQLEADTLELLRSLGRNPPLEWPQDISGLGYWMVRIRIAAHLEGRGQLQRIRASAGTNVAIHQPGKETAFLGHSTSKADIYYIDRKRLPAQAVKPQRLKLPGENS